MIDLIIFALIVAAVAAFIYIKVTKKDPKAAWAAVVGFVTGSASAAYVWVADLWDKLV